MRLTTPPTRPPGGAGYWCTVPALACCFSAAGSFEEAQQIVNEAIKLQFQVTLEDRQELPRDPDVVVAYAGVDPKTLIS